MYLLDLAGEAKTMYKVIERALFGTCKNAIRKPLDHLMLLLMSEH